MQIVILHNAVTEHDALEDQDVLVQVETVETALDALGYEVIAVPCTLDLKAMQRRLEELRPTLVFNLVEGLEGADSLSHIAPSVLDAMCLPYTGNTTEATFLTAHKLLAKERLQSAGLPTPAWLISETHAAPGQPTAGVRDWIIKGTWEQASRNLDDDALTSGDEGAIHRQLDDRAARFRRPCYAEQFIAGREFNLAVLAGHDGPAALPPAEIDFSAFPPGKPRIVGYRAKWLADSFEYNHTPRHFDFPPEENPLLEKLKALALRCWEVFDLRGYARVDFRVDGQNQPWILEVNTNPCLSPDAGFAAALEQAGIPFETAIERIVRNALRGSTPAP